MKIGNLIMQYLDRWKNMVLKEKICDYSEDCMIKNLLWVNQKIKKIFQIIWKLEEIYKNMIFIQSLLNKNKNHKI